MQVVSNYWYEPKFYLLPVFVVVGSVSLPTLMENYQKSYISPGFPTGNGNMGGGALQNDFKMMGVA